MNSVSHREFTLLVAWLQEEWNKPSRTDHYLMKIVSYLARLPGKGPLHQLSYFKIPWSWERKEAISGKSLDQQRAEQSHGIFSSIFGSKKPVNKRENVPRG